MKKGKDLFVKLNDDNNILKKLKFILLTRKKMEYINLVKNQILRKYKKEEKTYTLVYIHVFILL